MNGRRPRQVTRADRERVSRVATFGCELGALESLGLARERWDDVPALSEGYKPARDIIVGRLPACASSASGRRGGQRPDPDVRERL